MRNLEGLVAAILISGLIGVFLYFVIQADISSKYNSESIEATSHKDQICVQRKPAKTWNYDIDKCVDISLFK